MTIIGEEMIERVARAIYEQQFPGSLWPETADRAESWREMARAAIEAMGSPEAVTVMREALEKIAGLQPAGTGYDLANYRREVARAALLKVTP